MSNNAEIAIKVSNVHKTFKLPHEKQSSIKGLFINMFRGKRTYEKQHVLKDISFEIKKGEFFGIVGRNGSGKSTLLKLLAGIYSPDSGHIQVNGKLTPFIELGVGFNPELTGRENVFLNGALLGFNRKEMLAMYDEIIEFAELEKFMDQKLKNYSSGMQVRLAFSIAIRAQSDILLLDEVLAVGDVAFQSKCINYFKQLKEGGSTVVFVSHDTASIERFCDRVLVIDKGIFDGIYSAEKGVQRYQDFNLKSEIKDAKAAIKKSKSVIKDKIIQNASISPKSKKGAVTVGGEAIGIITIDTDRLRTKHPNLPGMGVIANIFNKDGVLVASLESAKGQYRPDTVRVKFNIKKLPLSPGIYHAYFGLYSANSDGSDLKIESMDEGVVFGIESADSNVTKGIVQLDSEWTK